MVRQRNPKRKAKNDFQHLSLFFKEFPVFIKTTGIVCEGLIIFMDIEIIYSFDFFDMCGTIIFVYMRSEFAGDVQEGHG